MKQFIVSFVAPLFILQAALLIKIFLVMVKNVDFQPSIIFGSIFCEWHSSVNGAYRMHITK